MRERRRPLSLAWKRCERGGGLCRSHGSDAREEEASVARTEAMRERRRPSSPVASHSPFHLVAQIVLPAIHAFDADLVLVSSGLDAAKGDPIGDCSLSPNFYHLMTRSLLTLIDLERTKLAVVLEGGYNLDVIPGTRARTPLFRLAQADPLFAACMEAIACALAGVPLPARLANPGKDALRIPLTSDRLVRARVVMADLWNWFDKDTRRRGNTQLGKGVVATVNRTIRALQLCDRYKDKDGSGGAFRPVVEQADDGLVIKTRKQRGAGGKGGGKDDDVVDMLGKLDLGNRK
jgi:hypothetical protein